MIFVTVGTHEQQFDRLIKEVDDLKKNGAIQEEVIIQTGFCTYEPQYCTWQKLYPYEEMVKNVQEASIVITHGGPSSFIMPLQVGRIPIVVPRMKDHNEHVNNHQLEFARAVAERQGNIIVVEDVHELGKTLRDYHSIVQSMPAEMKSNNAQFNQKFQEIVDQMFGERK